MRKDRPDQEIADGNVGALVRTMPRDELAKLWQRRWRRESLKGLRRRLLEYNAAWLLQADVKDGLSAEARRRLEALPGSGRRNR